MIRALFGGSFDPVHAGHVAVIDVLVRSRLADVVHVVPARQSPFKSAAGAAAGAQRLTMLALALAGRADIVIDDRELRRHGPSYSVDTLSELTAEYPDDSWRLVVGADHVATFGDWQEPERLLSLAEVVVVARGAVDLAPPLAGRALVVADFRHPAVATQLRADLAAGRRPPASLLPPAVADHIAAHGLYGWPSREGTP